MDQANTDKKFLLRCAQLAGLGDAKVSNNPFVGALLVYDNRIIGEGFHRRAGTAHAEVNCLASVREADRPLIAESTLYISLEPCCVTGRTGACTDVIRAHGIPRVVFAQRDATPGVDGRSVRILRAAGVEVAEYPHFTPTLLPNAHRRVLTLKQRPRVTLKWARSADGFLRPADREQAYWLTNAFSRRLVHRWRANTAAVIVGGRTVVEDDPALTTRLFFGPNPVPVVVDPRNRVTGRERVFVDHPRRALLFAGSERPDVDADVAVVPGLGKRALTQVLTELAQRGLGQLTVEGGARVLEAFLSAGYWDEARVFTGRQRLGGGLPAPALPAAAQHRTTERIGTDTLRSYTNPQTPD